MGSNHLSGFSLNRKAAIEWWNHLHEIKQIYYCEKHFKGFHHKTLTGSNVQVIWESKPEEAKTKEEWWELRKLDSRIWNATVPHRDDEMSLMEFVSESYGEPIYGWVPIVDGQYYDTIIEKV
jgi:hypothetical protein